MGIITLNITAQAALGPTQSGWIKVPVANGSTHVFTVANFTTETTPAFIASGALDKVKVTSIPFVGSLALNSVAVLPNQEITEADITSGLLVYTADVLVLTNYVDSGMSFLVSDVVSNLYYHTPQTAAFSVSTSINSAPDVIGDGEAFATLGTPYVFTRASLTTDLSEAYNDPEADAASQLLIDLLPIYGRLELDGVIQVQGDIIDFSDIDLGLFVYITEILPKVGEAEEFSFKISDVGSGEFRG
mgnify:CR=1 FL=1